MEKNLNFLDRNEFNYSPSKEVVEALKNFDINKLCFYTRIYDEGKKSILSVFLSELYDIDETQVLLGYGGEDILKQAVHYFLTEEDGNKTMLIPKFSWWYYKSIADEVNGRTLQYPLYEDGNTFKYDFAAMKDMIQKENPKILLLASPNNPTGNGLTPEELEERGIESLPKNLQEAVEEFEKDPLMKEVLGEEVCGKYSMAKKKEWEDYNATVSQWEIDSYLLRI